MAIYQPDMQKTPLTTVMKLDESKNYDPLLIQRLAIEFQLRIGTLPKVDINVLHLEANPGDVFQSLVVHPKSYSEIARTVRAARKMKLSVRGLGQGSGSERGIYVDMHTVLVDLCQLADNPRMEITKIQRLGDSTLTPGLRVLAGVTVEELTEFCIDKGIKLYQSAYTGTGLGTIVGNIVVGDNGVISLTGGPLGGSLCDEIIAMRIVDSGGELIEYSDALKLRMFGGNFGLLGIVYDVVLRYRELSVSQVSLW